MNLSKSMTRKLAKAFTTYQHYYVRESDQNKPIATIAIGLTTDSGKPCRGIAICSCIEPFVKEEGRKRAYERLLAAAHRQASDLPMNTDSSGAESVSDLLDELDWEIEGFKSGFDVCLTPSEHEILFSRR